MDRNDWLLTVRSRLGGWHGRGRKWRRFLRELPLDPDALARPVPAPGERDVMICGFPRSGTTLLAAELFRPPRMVTVVEPWDGMRKAPRELFLGIRDEVAASRRVSPGRLDVAALHKEGRVRRRVEADNPAVDVDLESEAWIGVKWPAFWRYLELLPDTRFLVCVRHPREVIASFRRIGGRLGMGLEFDTRFNSRLNETLLGATSDPAVRRALLYEHIGRAIAAAASRANVLLVHYERWHTDRAALLVEVAEFLDIDTSPPLVGFERPGSVDALTASDLDLIREHCGSAKEFGYALG